MATITVTLKDLPAAWERHLRRDRAALARLSKQLIEDAHEHARFLAIREDLIFERDYIDGFGVRRFPDGATLFNDAEHADTIEFGRRPGARMPPEAPIRRWVEGKLGVDPAESKGVAYLVRLKIQREGLPPHQIAARTHAWARNLWRDRVRSYLRTKGGTGL